MNTKLSIQNTTWYVKDLSNLIDKIIKPKFQRKSRWLITPDKNNKKPSYSEYIKFLFKTENSVDPISFGIIIQNNTEYYVNIDGNNRLNALITFINQPLLVFKNVLSQEIGLLKKFIPEEIYNNLNYNLLSGFRRLNEVEHISKFTDNQEDHKKLEDIMIDIQNKLLVNKTDKFTDIVKLNINIFKNGTYEDYNEIFSSINKHSNELSENDLLASLLFSKNIKMPSDNISYQILNKIKIYYNNRDEGEVLSNRVDVNINNLNIFDYMIGLQNVMHDRCGYLKEYSSKGLGYIFRIFKIVFGLDSIDLNSFEKFQNKLFTKKCLEASEILNKLFNNISNDNINKKIFSKKNGHLSSIIRENTKILLITTILSMKEQKTYTDEYIISKLSISTFYHIIQKSLHKISDQFNDNENKLYLILLGEDKLQYQAGGKFIDNLCKKIYNNKPKLLTDSSTPISFKKALLLLVKYSNKPVEKRDKKNPKRRVLTLFHRIFYNIIVRLTTPINLLNEKYSIEHLIPFSVKYENKLDRDRIGNLFPIPLEYNKKRGNKSIVQYNDICKEYYLSTINNILSKEDYDKVVKYDGLKPFIDNNNMFDKICEKVEKCYIDKCIKFLFK